MVAAEFLKAGFSVLRPGQSARYDLVIDTGKEFLRVQVKSSHCVGGYVRFKLYSQNGYYPKRPYTKEEIDLFAIYNFELDSIYILPVESKITRLRIDETKNGQESGINWGRDYTFEKWLSAFVGPPTHRD